MIYQQVSLNTLEDNKPKKARQYFTFNILHNASTHYLIRLTSLMSDQDDMKEVLL